MRGVEQSEARQRAEHIAHFAERVAGELVERRRVACLEIDQSDLVTRIGEHHGDAAPHAARAEAGDGFFHCKPSRSIACSAVRSTPPKPSAVSYTHLTLPTSDLV